MVETGTDRAAFIVLVDDDRHSANLLMRTLAEQGGPAVRHYETPQLGEAELAKCLGDARNVWPGLVIVDLKSHGGAHVEFVARNQAALRQRGIPLAVMAAPLDRARRQVLHQAGASAVYFRQAAPDAYRHEVAGLLRFWARSPCLDAVGM